MLSPLNTLTIHMENVVKLLKIKKSEAISQDECVQNAEEGLKFLLKLKKSSEKQACQKLIAETMHESPLSQWLELYARVIYCHLYTDDPKAPLQFLDVVGSLRGHQLYRQSIPQHDLVVSIKRAEQRQGLKGGPTLFEQSRGRQRPDAIAFGIGLLKIKLSHIRDHALGFFLLIPEIILILEKSGAVSSETQSHIKGNINSNPVRFIGQVISILAGPLGLEKENEVDVKVDEEDRAALTKAQIPSVIKETLKLLGKEATAPLVAFIQRELFNQQYLELVEVFELDPLSDEDPDSITPTNV